MITTKIGDDDYMHPDDVSDQYLLEFMLGLALKTEIASLKYAMTSKRRETTHKFILECFDRLIKSATEDSNQEIKLTLDGKEIFRAAFGALEKSRPNGGIKEVCK